MYKDTIYGGPIDGWANGPNKPSPEYDELHNYAKVSLFSYFIFFKCGNTFPGLYFFL